MRGARVSRGGGGVRAEEDPVCVAGQQPQNSTNPNSVAQYDVACYQVSH
jgi:hypothetical protein